jgi:hypothetical protein
MKIATRPLLLATATLILGLLGGYLLAARTSQPLDVAVYAEYSDVKKPMALYPAPVGGWNIRVFNRQEVQKGQSIRLEEKTGTVILAPGLYHITAISEVAYDDPATEPAGTMLTKLRPYGGYCRLRYLADAGSRNEKAIAIGTIGNANSQPSLIDTYLEVKDEAKIVLEHQVGDKLEGIYLQLYVANSSWHVFARISIRKV